MAIKRLNPKQTFKVISRLDDSLDNETPEELKTGVTDENGKEIKKPSRYDEYVEADLDESKLKFKEGAKPDRLVVRCLTNDEQAELNAKHVKIDVIKKEYVTKNQVAMFIETFKLGLVGLETADGKIEKVNPDEFEYLIAFEVGSIISMLGTLGKNQKK